MLPTLARTYLVTALEGTPGVLNGFLGGLAPDDARWDIRPSPERFTLREIVAHLAFSEPNWRERAERIRDENAPFFPRAAIQDAETEAQPPATNLTAFAESRRRFVAVLSGLDEAHWERAGHSESLGSITVEQFAVFVLAHDGYHVRQVAEWLAAASRSE